MDERLTFGEARRLLGVSGDADPRALRRAFAAAALSARGDEAGLRRLIAAWRLLARPAATAGSAWLPAALRQDFRTELRVSLAEAAAGALRLVETPDGRVWRLRIPAGARDGVTLRLPGRSPSGGDVLIRLRVRAAGPSRRTAGDLIRRFSQAWAA